MATELPPLTISSKCLSHLKDQDRLSLYVTWPPLIAGIQTRQITLTVTWQIKSRVFPLLLPVFDHKTSISRHGPIICPLFLYSHIRPSVSGARLPRSHVSHLERRLQIGVIIDIWLLDAVSFQQDLRLHLFHLMFTVLTSFPVSIKPSAFPVPDKFNLLERSVFGARICFIFLLCFIDLSGFFINGMGIEFFFPENFDLVGIKTNGEGIYKFLGLDSSS